MNKQYFMRLMGNYAAEAFELALDAEQRFENDLECLEFMHDFLGGLIEMEKDSKHIAFKAEMAAKARLENPYR